ncbi:MAG: septal ring lytic transglycosylase RlpA family protein [Colwellia sp.]|nr:septal ring lytic transglycosylase RlpA family protein [Colwellia sp.]
MIKTINKIRKPTLLILLMLLTACSSSRYQHANDSIPTRSPNQAELTDAIARAEPHSKGGNKNYRVRGIDYEVLNSAKGFEQIGTASWYGNKFHGHLTSNGEIYDMYSMSAAHKHLPLPTYLTVTNLANNKSVIVRVNDRGPFHQNRIIDLSFSAAYKLDMLKIGTAKVKITALTEFRKKTISNKSLLTSDKPKGDKPKENKEKVPQKISVLTHKKNIIQVFATSNFKVAKITANDLAKLYSQTVSFPEKEGVYRIQIGPFSDQNQQKLLLNKLQNNGYPNAYLKRL